MREGYWKVIISDNNGYFENVLKIIQRTVREQEEEYKNLEQKFKDKTVDETGYNYQDYLGDVAHEHWNTEQGLYKSFVVSIVMFMESKLLELCSHLQKEFKYAFSVYDLKHTGVTRSINYLKKLGISFPKDNKIKEDFSVAFSIRNKLVHADGKIDDLLEQKEFEEKYKNYQGKFELWYGEIAFEEAYLKDLIALNEKICDEISDNWLVKEFP